MGMTQFGSLHGTRLHIPVCDTGRRPLQRALMIHARMALKSHQNHLSPDVSDKNFEFLSEGIDKVELIENWLSSSAVFDDLGECPTLWSGDAQQAAVSGRPANVLGKSLASASERDRGRRPAAASGRGPKPSPASQQGHIPEQTSVYVSIEEERGRADGQEQIGEVRYVHTGVKSVVIIITYLWCGSSSSCSKATDQPDLLHCQLNLYRPFKLGSKEKSTALTKSRPPASMPKGGSGAAGRKVVSLQRNC